MLAAGSDMSSVGKRYQQQRDERGFSTWSLREMTKGVEIRGRLLERTCVSRISWDLNYTRDAVRASPLAFVPTQGPETVQLEANHKVCTRLCPSLYVFSIRALQASFSDLHRGDLTFAV